MKKVLILLLAFLFVAALFGCAKKQELRAVTLNEVTRSVFYAPLYVAATKGFFAEEGMEITIVTGGGSDKSMTALLSGDAQVALMGPETGIYVVNEGKEEHPIIVAQLTKRDGSFLVGRQSESNFDFASLRGKTIIGGRPGGMPFMTLCYVLRAHGLEPNVDVTVIDNIQFNLMGGAFESGTGDYVTLFEPTASLFEKEGKGFKVANMGLESGEVPYTTFMVQQKTIDEDPAFVEAFVRAIYRAQVWVKTASDAEVAKAMLPYFPDTDQATLELVAKSYRATDSWTDVPTMTEDAFARLQDVMAGAGVLSARVEFDTLVNNSFGVKAMAEVGK
ncbi:MAG: ABC transporter substrate-binding protein [Clostridiaceae bacterium]|nr:ABC transporter substrate-binding protein [Eubacteriales bacterium]